MHIACNTVGPPELTAAMLERPATIKWDLWMIAVAPDRQGHGIGGALLRSEDHARASHGRLLLIETSSLPRFDATRAFYGKHDYTEVARIPDFYTDGDSKVVFAKRITAP